MFKNCAARSIRPHIVVNVMIYSSSPRLLEGLRFLQFTLDAPGINSSHLQHSTNRDNMERIAFKGPYTNVWPLLNCKIKFIVLCVLARILVETKLSIWHTTCHMCCCMRGREGLGVDSGLLGWERVKLRLKLELEYLG